MTQALIALGSNLGDRRSNLEGAIEALAGTPGVEVRAVSTFHATSPVGGPEGQGAFLNAAAVLEIQLDPEPLLDLLNAIEARAKRVRVIHWGARTLDLDLLLYGNQVIRTPRLIVPHPRMALRRFVLAPLNEVAPAAIDPMTTRSIAELLANLDRRPSTLALHGDDAPLKEILFHQVVSKLGAEAKSFSRLHSQPQLSTRPLDQVLDPATARWRVTDFCPPLLWPATALSRDDDPPTFVVILKSGEVEDTPTGLLTFPHLVVDPSDPDRAIAEVLAACAATRS
ncbi:2-amino-4-hydroxy-6-hydroxymethyldihydropteridinediphosphokinase [Singulisphaera sp. GP187]|uniref:2-amino-4-hydroxy-6- hydroxymethyldihydropteridine diphosphokinase n=1 Tax=Singulisphaera sp. GP187 TaxID=1882752 RepID=UPI00092BEF66|nr:2-amino-4-hydroxy-6-hydroxymethyldihydropteridine diphosphokinase [Singulisphaera sp. GP187]SIN88710.1 2-amino-4-hydroxy-6-hydroxymethyldihydropteridinediphosphokinase [Singulisphaera sp. GP187]